MMTSRLVWWLPAFAAATIMAVDGYLLCWSRDFGAVVLWGLLLLAKMGVCAGLMIWAIWTKSRMATSSAFLTVGTIAVLSFGLFLAGPISNQTHNSITFALWCAFHPKQVNALKGNDRIISEWDGWGRAGSENDSYLVFQKGDDIGSANAATTWAKREKLACDIVDSQRMKPGLYIITTYNCSLGS